MDGSALSPATSAGSSSWVVASGSVCWTDWNPHPFTVLLFDETWAWLGGAFRTTLTARPGCKRAFLSKDAVADLTASITDAAICVPFIIVAVISQPIRSDA